MITVALPVMIPLTAGALCLLIWGRARIQAAVAIIALVAMLLSSVALLVRADSGAIDVMHFGAWDAPVGITFVADRLGAMMTVLAAITGLAAAIFSIGSLDAPRARGGHYPLLLTLVGAVAGAFLTGDLFNLYVWFELLLLSSFVLLTLGGTRPQLEGAIKYVTLNLIGSLIFLATVGLIYGATGTLNMAHLARIIPTLDPAFATALAAPLLVAFGIKAAVFPVFYWLPASYHTPPPVVSALFAGLLTKVGVYALIRSILLFAGQETELVGVVVLWVAGFTMLTGVLGAVAQTDMRRILSFHIVSQIGYMLMGLGIAMAVVAKGGPDAGGLAALALAGSIFYIFHHIVVKTNLFLVSGAVIRARGDSNLATLGGLLATHPALAVLFLFSALSLAGIPILSGFWAKVALVKSGLIAEQWAIVAASLIVSILTLFSMMKIWTAAFWGQTPESAPSPRDRAHRLGASIYGPIAGLAVVSLAIALGGSVAFGFASRTAEQLLDPSDYERAVLPAPAIAPDAEGGV
jgi:multicomponent Na+:H+ antiporter subunit D